jgi:hypothetical protein
MKPPQPPHPITNSTKIKNMSQPLLKNPPMPSNSPLTPSAICLFHSFAQSQAFGKAFLIHYMYTLVSVNRADVIFLL